MTNLSLTKDDGLLYFVPPSAITAVLSTVNAKNPAHPKARSVVFSTIRGLSVTQLAASAEEVFALIADQAPAENGPEWFRIPSGGDASYINPAAVTHVEEARLEASDELVVRVWFSRTDGLDVFADGDHSPEFLDQAAALIGRSSERSTVINPPRPAPRSPIPGGRRSKK